MCCETREKFNITICFIKDDVLIDCVITLQLHFADIKVRLE